MKKIVLVTLLVCAMTSMAMASPLTDYSKGNAALDITYRNSSTYDVDAGVKGTEVQIGGALDGEKSFELGFTYGLGNNLALQYRQATPKGKVTLFDRPESQYNPQVRTAESYYRPGIHVGLEAKTKVEEYNVLYKLDKNFSLFTGLVRATPKAKLSASVHSNGTSVFNGSLAIQGDDKNIWQFGVLATAPIADKLNAYGLAAFGGDYRNWEVGLGYEISKNLEMNVNYRDMKVEDMKLADLSVCGTSYDVSTDTRAKGWGLGVTYKF